MPAQQEVADVNVEVMPKLDTANAFGIAKNNSKPSVAVNAASETSRGMNRHASEREMPSAEEQFAAQLGA